MKSKGHTVPAKAKRWMAWVARQRCANCTGIGVHVHHCAGATARHNKVAIGDWWLLPLCPKCHQGDHGIHGDRMRFFGDSLTRKQTEKSQFARLLAWAVSDGACLDAPTQHIIDTIEDYHV